MHAVRRAPWMLLAAAAVALATGCDREVQPRDERPVKLSVPHSQGTRTDALGRILGRELGEALKAPVSVLEGRSGPPLAAVAPWVAHPHLDASLLVLTSSDVIAVAPALDSTLASALDRNFAR